MLTLRTTWQAPLMRTTIATATTGIPLLGQAPSKGPASARIPPFNPNQHQAEKMIRKAQVGHFHLLAWLPLPPELQEEERGPHPAAGRLLTS